MPKSSFVLYLDYKKHFDLIQDDTDFRRLIEAIFAYCETGTEPSDLSPVALMAFSFIRANLDRDSDKYEAVKEKRKEAGRLGGLAKASNAKQMLAKASNAKQNLANVADTVTVTDTGNVDCNTITPHTPQGGRGAASEEYSDDFELFWHEYPNHNSGKKKAYAAFKRALKKISLAELLKSVDAHKKSSQWTKDGGAYIPHATTWLNGERWTVEMGVLDDGREVDEDGIVWTGRKYLCKN